MQRLAVAVLSLSDVGRTVRAPSSISVLRVLLGLDERVDGLELEGSGGSARRGGSDGRRGGAGGLSSDDGGSRTIGGDVVSRGKGGKGQKLEEMKMEKDRRVELLSFSPALPRPNRYRYESKDTGDRD